MWMVSNVHGMVILLSTLIKMVFVLLQFQNFVVCKNLVSYHCPKSTIRTSKAVHVNKHHQEHQAVTGCMKKETVPIFYK